MKLVNIFLKNPCVGWLPVNREDFKDFYTCTDEFTEDFITGREKYKLLRKEVECIGSAMLVHLTLKTVYSIQHKDANQAEYYADAVLVEG